MPTSDIFREKRQSALNSIIRGQGGKTRNWSYVALRKPLTVTCKNGHVFRVTAKNLLRGSWCPKCRPLGRQEEFLEFARKVAKRNGGRCLSESYVNARTNLVWKCSANHTWQATLDNVANKKSWCPTCSLLGASDRKTRWWRSRRLQTASRSRRR